MFRSAVGKWEATRKADWTTTFTLCKRDSDGIVSDASFDDLKDAAAASCCMLVPAGSVFMSTEQANAHFAKTNALMRAKDDAIADRDKALAELESAKSELAHLCAKTQDCMGGCGFVQGLVKERDEWKERAAIAEDNRSDGWKQYQASIVELDSAMTELQDLRDFKHRYQGCGYVIRCKDELDVIAKDRDEWKAKCQRAEKVADEVQAELEQCKKELGLR